MALLPLLQQWWQELQATAPFNLFLLALPLLFVLVFFLNLPRGSKLNLPPSPPKLPLIGNLHQLGILPHRSLETLSKKYGPLMLLQLGSAPTLVVSSAETAKEIMKTHDIVFADRVQTKVSNSLYFGSSDVAFSPYGDYWRQVRKICVLELLSLKRVQSYQSVREEEVAELMENLRRSSKIGASVNLAELLVNLSNNIVSKAALGRKFEVEAGEKSFGESARRVMELFGEFSFEDFFPSLAWLDSLTGLTSSIKKTSNSLHSYLDQVIDEHKLTKTDGDLASGKKDFVEILLHLQKHGMLDINLSQDNLKAIILDMFIGGTDTTSVTMEWAMAEVVRNPTILKKAQDEVRRIVGKKARIEETDINQMNYLKCIIKEALRLYAVLPFLAPRESTATVKVGGYDIPAKTRVFVNVWAIQRDPTLWDRPLEFIPERFDNNPIDYKGQDFQYLPFGAGRRGCPGITFAMAQAEYVLANLLYWFDWELPGGARGEDMDMTEVYGLVIHKKIPLEVVPLAPKPF